MRFPARPLVLSAVLACTASLAGAADNPAYASWAKHKPGTSVTMTGTTEAAGVKTGMEQVYTLKEVTPEKVVVELRNAMTMMDKKTEMPVQTMEIKKEAAGPGQQPGAMPAGQPGANAATKADESVTVAGKQYRATRTEATNEQGGNKTIARVWTSPEVPGTLLKMESVTEGAMRATTTLEVTKVELKD